MKTLHFNNNDAMPALGLGTWKSKPGEVYDAVKTAIKQGYRHIDCAPVYANEKEVGRALSESVLKGTVSRKDLWITSKLWNDAHAAEDVIPALNQTLKDLQVDYLDLYLIHWPVAVKKGTSLVRSAGDLVSLNDIPISETWRVMEKVLKLGLVKHIGVSNFGIEKLRALISTAKIKPEMNQVESHPYLQQDELLAFCKQHHIHFTAYSPLGSSDRPATLRSEHEPKLLEDPVIATIARSKNATPAQVLISWSLHRGTSVIPKSVNPERIARNFKASDINLTKDEMNTIAGLNRNLRYVTGEFWVFDDGPYTLKNLWE